MKKKILTTFIAGCFVLFGNAQSAPGTLSITPKAGLNVSNLSNNAPMQIIYAVAGQHGDSWEITSETNTPQVIEQRFSGHSVRYGFTGGVEFGYQICNRVALAAELLYSVQGADYDDFISPDNTTERKNVVADMRGINIPITVKYYIYKGLSVRAGLQPSFLSNKLKGDFYHKGTAIEISDNKADYLSTFGLSVPVGLCYEYKSFVVDARVNMGMTNIYNDKWENSKSSSHNNVFALTIGYKFSHNGK